MGKGSNEPRVDVLRPLKLGVHKKTLSFWWISETVLILNCGKCILQNRFSNSPFVRLPGLQNQQFIESLRMMPRLSRWSQCTTTQKNCAPKLRPDPHTHFLTVLAVTATFPQKFHMVFLRVSTNLVF